MQPELFLITPPEAEPGFAAILAEALAPGAVAAVLIQRGAQDEAAYRALAAALIPVIQQAGAAALIDNDAALVRELEADGAHITSGLEAIRAAIALLKPRLIVGAGGLRSRHDAMEAGEAGIDYLFFGSLGPVAAGADFAALAEWWIENFTIPAIWFPGDAGPAPEAPKAEFLALRGSVWSAPGGPAKALAQYRAPARGAA